MALILLNKPFRTLCQFTDDSGRATLADWIETPGVYPAGRLDYDSEGLVALTDDGRLQARISEPSNKLARTYWVQVEGTPSADQLQRLCGGVVLKDGPAAAAHAAGINEPAALWPRTPPIRARKNVPDSWLQLTLEQGRNRQVRRMTAAVGLPTLRLIRCRIGPWTLAGLRPGEFRQIAGSDAWRQIRSFTFGSER
jgi:23S rRNA pseudouridine2457 synthase